MKRRVGLSALVGAAGFALVFFVSHLVHFHSVAVPHTDVIYGVISGTVNAAVFFTVWPAVNARKDPD